MIALLSIYVEIQAGPCQRVFEHPHILCGQIQKMEWVKENKEQQERMLELWNIAFVTPGLNDNLRFDPELDKLHC